MNLRDALLAEHDADRLSVEADRRLRRRLGLETARASSASRRAWRRPVFAAAAGVALAAAVIIVMGTRSGPDETRPEAAFGFVDVSKSRWTGTVSGDEIDVRASSPSSATVTWQSAAIVAAPGTRLATRADGTLVLTTGDIRIHRTEMKPLVVVVPTGRVVIASYHSQISVQHESVEVLFDDGTGEFTDSDGQTYALSPSVPFASPSSSHMPASPGAAVDAGVPAIVPPDPDKPPGGRSVAPSAKSRPVPVPASGPPGLTPPAAPRRADMPCTYKSDCEPGATCRRNEHGQSVCMGNGPEGAACWFGTDCLSLSCTQRRCR